MKSEGRGELVHVESPPRRVTVKKILYLIVLIGLILFFAVGWYYLMDMYSNSMDETSSLIVLMVFGVLTLVAFVYLTARKFTPVLKIHPIKVYENGIEVPGIENNLYFRKQKIERVYMINWVMPERYRKSYAGIQVKGLGFDLIDGSSYETKVRDTGEIRSVLDSIQSAWGVEYVGEERDVQRSW